MNKGDRGSSAGARHGSRPTDKPAFSGLNERNGEFNIGESVIMGMRNGNVLLRHSPQGDEVEVSETTLAGLLEDAFFTGKLDGYPTVDKQKQSA